MRGFHMNIFKILALMPVCGLIGCGAPADNVGNTPLSGKWMDEGKLMAITWGGTSIDTSKMPQFADLKSKVTKSKEFCGEPYFRNKEEFQAEMDKNNPGECQVETVEANGDRAKAAGVCKAILLPGVEGQATFSGQSRMKPDKVVYDMTINVIVRDKQTGAGEKVTMEAQRTMTRLGDC
jgi:Protein of unknown function (DUF3617)